MIIWYLFWIKMYKNWIFNVSMQKDCTVCVLNDLKPFCVQYFLKFFVFFWCLKFCPACISLLLAHIWILHKILGRNALFLERFKKFCLKSKYPNRVYNIHYISYMSHSTVGIQNPIVKPLSINLYSMYAIYIKIVF